MVKILATLIIIMGVLIGIDGLVRSVSEVPTWFETPWRYIALFFSSTPWIILVGFGRNVLGFLRNYFRTQHAAQYNPDKLYETWSLYAASVVAIVAFASAVPSPYDKIATAVGSAIVVVVDLITSEIGHLREKKK